MTLRKPKRKRAQKAPEKAPEQLLGISHPASPEPPGPVGVSPPAAPAPTDPPRPFTDSAMGRQIADRGTDGPVAGTRS